MFDKTSVWKGIYASFDEAGDHSDDLHDSARWLNKQKDRVIEALQCYDEKAFVSNDYPLSIIVSMLMSSNNSVSVLDFGGGTGENSVFFWSEEDDFKR